MWTSWRSVQSWDALEKNQHPQPKDQKIKCNEILDKTKALPTSPTTTASIMGHSVICLNLAQRPVCTSRSSSKLSFLITALLAFSFGIGIGVFIPLYFLPVSNSASITTTEFIQVEQPLEFTLTPQSVINIDSSSPSSLVSADDDNRRTLYLKNEYSSTPSTSYNVVPSRLNHHRRTTTTTARTTVRGNLLKNREKSLTQPSYRRPTLSSVKFIVPDVRLLSLDPIQHDDSPVRILNYESRGSRSNNNDSEDIFSKVSSSLTNINKNNAEDDELLDGIYWSDKVEQSLPQGFTDQDIQSWREFVKRSSVANIQEGCGRMQNRLLSFQNGTQACCRYRHNFDQIQGEIFGFYLSQILGIRNLAPSALAIIKSKDPQWSSVRQQLNLAQWAEEKPVVMTQFIDSLAQAYIPGPFRGSNRRLHPIDIAINPPLLNSVENNNNVIVNSDSSSASKDIQELAQWSDLIVFDYLTANLDRMVNNLYNLQWNPSMMEAPAHNLAKDTRTGLLVFLDNESGLLHGYRLLDKYEQYHRIMLDSLCVFRKSTAQAIKKLHGERNVGKLLKNMFASVEGAEIMTNYLPMIPDKSIKILNHRIDRVYDQISKCESLYMSSSSSSSPSSLSPSKSEV